MGRIEQDIVDRFRDSLPAHNAREAWVNETCLELARFRHMREQGVRCAPRKGSLLDNLLTIADDDGPVVERIDEVRGEGDYAAMFHQKPSYCWTLVVQGLPEHALSPATTIDPTLSPGTLEAISPGTLEAFSPGTLEPATGQTGRTDG